MALREMKSVRPKMEENQVLSSSKPLPRVRPSNWQKQWEHVIDERLAARGRQRDSEDLTGLLKDLFG